MSRGAAVRAPAGASYRDRGCGQCRARRMTTGGAEAHQDPADERGPAGRGEARRDQPDGHRDEHDGQRHPGPGADEQDGAGAGQRHQRQRRGGPGAGRGAGRSRYAGWCARGPGPADQGEGRAQHDEAEGDRHLATRSAARRCHDGGRAGRRAPAVATARSTAIALLRHSLVLGGRVGVGHDARAGLDVGDPVAQVGGADRDRGVGRPGEVEVAHAAAVDAATGGLELLDQLHRPWLGRARQGARREAGRQHVVRGATRRRPARPRC